MRIPPGIIPRAYMLDSRRFTSVRAKTSWRRIRGAGETTKKRRRRLHPRSAAKGSRTRVAVVRPSFWSWTRIGYTRPGPLHGLSREDGGRPCPTPAGSLRHDESVRESSAACTRRLYRNAVVSFWLAAVFRAGAFASGNRRCSGNRGA